MNITLNNALTFGIKRPINSIMINNEAVTPIDIPHK